MVMQTPSPALVVKVTRSVFGPAVVITKSSSGKREGDALVALVTSLSKIGVVHLVSSSADGGQAHCSSMHIFEMFCTVGLTKQHYISTATAQGTGVQQSY